MATTKVVFEIDQSADPEAWVLIPVQGTLRSVIIEAPDNKIFGWYAGDKTLSVDSGQGVVDVPLTDMNANLVSILAMAGLKR